MMKFNTKNSFIGVDGEVRFARITIFARRECAGRSPPVLLVSCPELTPARNYSRTCCPDTFRHEKTQIIDSLSKHIYSLWELPKRSHLQDCNLNNYCLSSQQHPFCAVIVAKMLGLTAIMLSFISFTHCHTWIDQLSIIDSNNQPIGAPGFIRGYGMSSHPSTIAMLKPHHYNDF